MTLRYGGPKSNSIMFYGFCGMRNQVGNTKGMVLIDFNS